MKVDVLLISPPSSYTEKRIFPPLGLAYIASVLMNAGIHVEIIDSPALHLSYEHVNKIIRKKHPQIIGIQTSFFNFYECRKLTETIKNSLPDVHIILGGQFPSSFPQKVLREIPKADVCVMGEGESIMLELVRALSRGLGIEKIKGLVFRKGKNIHITPCIGLIKDLNSLPFPARHLLPMKAYRFLPHEFKQYPVVTMLSSRGCPFRCNFCSKPIFGSSYRVRSPENVISEIIEVINHYSAKEIFFVDDVFGLSRSWCEKFCKLLIQEKLDIAWSCQTRIDVMDRKLLTKMAASGCWSILFGIESCPQRLLNILNKNIRMNEVKKTIKLAGEAGISVRASFMIGIPTETKKETLQTIKFAKELNPDFALFHLFVPFEGTAIYKFSKQTGNILNGAGDYDYPGKVKFIPYTYGSEEELIKIQKFAYKNFYLNPNKIIEIISKIKSFNKLKSWLNLLDLAFI
jgi:radical SAM superfamily enzyme YgiQ (UPF0313 family)